MSNYKQSSVEWLAKQLKEKMQMWNSTKNYQEFHIVLEAGEFAKLIDEAKAMHHKEVVDFVEDWYCNGPLLGVDVLVSTSVEDHYNKTFGGNNEVY